MSDFDAGHLDTAHEDYDLDHGHQEYGNDHDAYNNYQAYGDSHAAEADEHYNNGNHVEYDRPNGSHFSSTEFTNYDAHAAEADSSYGVDATHAEHDSSFAELDALRA